MQDRVEVPDPVTLVGVSVQVRPAVGLMPEVRLTMPLKPLRGVMVMVDAPATPAATLTLVGLAVIVKS